MHCRRIVLPFQGDEKMTPLTQGLALGWYVWAFQAKTR
jgi:hypothetical protein